MFAESEFTLLTNIVQAEPIPSYEHELRAAIDRARHILDWPANWDGEGSPAYHIATLERAQDLLLAGARELWHIGRQALPVPRVTPGPDGSIDLHWQSANWQLLLNVPVATDELPTFYGEDRHTTIKGEVVHDATNLWLLAWVARER